MKIAIGADHAGYHLKAELAKVLLRRGVEVQDLGTNGEAAVDYPDFASAVAREVAAGRADRGLLVCGSGIGMSIAANKVPGVRAAVVSEEYSARVSRRHNDANILCLGGRVVAPGLAESILAAWLEEAFEGGRHETRVSKIAELEGRGAKK